MVCRPQVRLIDDVPRNYLPSRRVQPLQEPAPLGEAGGCALRRVLVQHMLKLPPAPESSDRLAPGPVVVRVEP